MRRHISSNTSTISVPKSISSSSATEVRSGRGTTNAEDRWRSSSRASVGRDLFDNAGGSSQEQGKVCDPPEPLMGAQGFDPYPAWPSPLEGILEEPRSMSPGTFPSVEEILPPASCSTAAAVPAAPPTARKKAGGAGRTPPHPARGGDSRGKRCQAEGCPSPPSYSVDGNKPAVLCGNHREEKMHRVQHDVKVCGHHGCKRTAEVSHMSQNGRIERFCSKHRISKVVTSPRTKHCEHHGCANTPLYGVKDGPLSFCQSHKRAGMYTNRNGILVVATRDGDAFRPTVTSVPSDTGAPAAGPSCEPGSSPEPATRDAVGDRSSSSPQEPTTAPSPADKLGPFHRKLCEVHGCEVQPSYGKPGTTRLQFCSGHKKKGMVSLKNRPCAFVGCDTRPHYGLPRGGRAVYCATHKEDGMVHVFKEASTQRKQEVSRKRADYRTRVSAASAMRKNGRSPTVAAAAAASTTTGSGKTRRGEIKHEDDDKNKKEKMTAEKGVKGRSRMRKAAVGRRVSGAGSNASGGKRGKKGGAEDEGAAAAVVQVSPTSPRSSKEPAQSSSNKRAPPTTAKSEGAAETGPSSSSATAPIPPPIYAPRSSCLATISGVSPFVETNRIKLARASAQAEAEASGSGRRPRAPSRKALEASGLLKNDGAQLMSKEMKQAEARRKKELKEQRRQYKAAGLKAGVVLEAFGVGDTDEATPGVGGGDSVGGAEQPACGETKRDEPSVASAGAASKESSGKRKRKGSVPAATAATGPEAGGGSVAETRSSAHVLPASSSSDGGPQGGDKSIDSEEPSNKRTKRTKEEDEGETERGQIASQTKRKGETRPNKMHRRSVANKGGTAASATAAMVEEKGDKSATSGTACAFDGCRKAAAFGVNGTARYCKTHRLFGMREVTDSK